jgi:hypothetical protein
MSCYLEPRHSIVLAHFASNVEIGNFGGTLEFHIVHGDSRLPHLGIDVSHVFLSCLRGAAWR